MEPGKLNGTHVDDTPNCTPQNLRVFVLFQGEVVELALCQGNHSYYKQRFNKINSYMFYILEYVSTFDPSSTTIMYVRPYSI